MADLWEKKGHTERMETGNKVGKGVIVMAESCRDASVATAKQGNVYVVESHANDRHNLLTHPLMLLYIDTLFRTLLGCHSRTEPT